MFEIHHHWLAVSAYVTFISIYLLYLYRKDGNKRKLTFSIALFVSSLSYIGLFLGLIPFSLENVSTLWYNIFTLTSLPILFAIVLATHERYLRIKNYDMIFYPFLILTTIIIGFVFIPYKLELFPTLLRQILSLEVIIVLIYNYYNTRKIDNLYFFFYIICGTVAGISFPLEYGYLSAFSFLCSYVFLTLIFIRNEPTSSNSKTGIGNYFSLEERLKNAEERYKQLFNTIPDALVLLSQDGTILDANSSLAANFELSPKEMMGRNIYDFLPTKIYENRKNYANLALESGKIQTNQDERNDKFLFNMYIPVIMDDGTNLLVLSRDITETIRAQGEKEEKINDLRNTELATLSIMEDMQEANTNLELVRKEVLDKNEELTTTMEEMQALNEELSVAREQLLDLNKNLESKVEERTDKIEKLLQQKNAFIHQLGHDLKTPITPLHTLLPIVQKKCTDEKINEMITICIDKVRYMKELVQNTLELARMNSPGFEIQLSDINLFESIDRIVHSGSFNYDANNIQVENLIPSDIQIKADNLRFEEIINNLVSNAVKYSPEGGNIYLKAEETKDDMIEIIIQDNGMGMTKEQIDHIFDEFYKADESRHDFTSTGLGLSICKTIIEKHQGTIWVESQGLGKGSTFHFTLQKSKKQEN